jgi:hypothetical protein
MKIETEVATEIGTETEIEIENTRSPMAFVFTIAAIFTDDRNAGARVQICVIWLRPATGAIESHRSAYSAAHTRSHFAT